MSIDFSRLLPLGWSNFFSTQIPLEALDRVRPARVVRVERDRYGVDAGAGEFFATLAGRFRHEHEGEALPTVARRTSRICCWMRTTVWLPCSTPAVFVAGS